MVVKVRHVLVQHSREMAAVNDQYPVQQFPAGSSNPSFGDRVRLGCPHRRAQDANTLAGEHGIEHAGELAVAVPNQEPELSHTITEVHQKTPRLLSHPGATRVGGDAEEWTRRVACST